MAAGCSRWSGAAWLSGGPDTLTCSAFAERFPDNRLQTVGILHDRADC